MSLLMLYDIMIFESFVTTADSLCKYYIQHFSLSVIYVIYILETESIFIIRCRRRKGFSHLGPSEELKSLLLDGNRSMKQYVYQIHSRQWSIN
jgi:hypothetical protein